jgi:putative transposase
MLGFKSVGRAQHFLSMHGAVHNAFYLERHLLSRRTLRLFEAEAAQAWQDATVAA